LKVEGEMVYKKYRVSESTKKREVEEEPELRW
jgi:hypothetical protein